MVVPKLDPGAWKMSRYCWGEGLDLGLVVPREPMVPGLQAGGAAPLGGAWSCVIEAVLWGHLTLCRAGHPDSSELRLHRHRLSLRGLVVKRYRL